jgi:hypothetical protein
MIKKHFSAAKKLYILPDRMNQGTYTAKKHDSGWLVAWIFLDSDSNRFQSRIKKSANDFYQKNCKTLHSSVCEFFIFAGTSENL